MGTLRRNHLLSVLGPITIVVVIALDALAQTAARQTVESVSTASAALDSGASAQAAEHWLLPGTGNSVPAVNRSQRKRHGTGPMDKNPHFFLPAVVYDSGGYTSTAVAVGDLNGDGKLDIVAGNECANSGCYPNGAAVAVLLGNGDGTFQPEVTYATGGSSGPFWPVLVAIADLNADHKPDLVVVNGGSSTVGVLLGNGDGTFQPAVNYGSGGMYPDALAAGDVNGDGKPDVVVANECADQNCDGSFGVLLGNGDGTFLPAVAYSSGGMYANAVALGDVNGDGTPDVLVGTNYMVCKGKSCSPTGAVGVLLGRGDGTFQPAVIYDSGGRYPFSLAVADLNADGKLDVVAADSWSGAAGVLMGNGDGTFQAAVAYGCGGGYAQINAVVVADVNEDGHPDVLITAQDSSAVCVLSGNGDGTLQPAVAYGSGGFLASGVAVGDVNGDGRPDLIVGNECIFNSDDCSGPISKARGVVGVLLNNFGAPPTTTTLVSSVNPAALQWVVTYTATVILQSGETVNGMVTFQEGGSTFAMVPLVNNQATCNTSYRKKGTYSITATYWGELNRAAGSTSDVLQEVIVVQHPTRTVVTTSGSPSMVGLPVTFTATVSSSYGTIPDGELVTFYDGTTTLGSVALANGIAAYSTSSFSAKTHFIKATYAGDATFKPSTGWVKQIVDKYPTTTALRSSPNPSRYGRAVKFTAHVTSAGPNRPTGKVWFKDGTTGIGWVTLSGGVAKLTKSKLAVGTHPITAQYLGDAASDRSTSSVLNQVVK